MPSLPKTSISHQIPKSVGNAIGKTHRYGSRLLAFRLLFFNMDMKQIKEKEVNFIFSS